MQQPDRVPKRKRICKYDSDPEAAQSPYPGLLIVTAHLMLRNGQSLPIQLPSLCTGEYYVLHQAGPQKPGTFKRCGRVV